MAKFKRLSHRPTHVGQRAGGRLTESTDASASRTAFSSCSSTSLSHPLILSSPASTLPPNDVIAALISSSTSSLPAEVGLNLARCLLSAVAILVASFSREPMTEVDGKDLTARDRIEAS